MNRFGFAESSEHAAWLGRVQEEVLEPDLPIVDAHHHLWVRDGAAYLLREFAADVDSGHNIVATVFAECHSMYRTDGPPEQRCVGESEFVAGIAAMSDSGQFGRARICRAMVGSVDPTLGEAVEPLLDAHQRASGGRFRGVRISAPWHEDSRLARIVDDPGYLRRREVRAAIAVLARRGLSLDVWVYHTQLDEVAALAEANPGLTIVLNHFGAPILGGPFRGREDEVFADWRERMARLAEHPKVVVKAGAMVIRARDRMAPDLPPGSADIQRAWQRWVDATVELFGPSRVMFESNFPVHKNWCSYAVLWNAFKRMAAGAGLDDRHELFAGTAARVYRLSGAGIDGTA